MFFKDIETWTSKKLRGLNVLFSFLHFIALVLIPIIIVGTHYDLFTKEEGGFKLTGIGIIVVVILGLYAYIKMKKVVDGLPQIKLTQQRFKFSLQAILSLIPLIILLVAINYAKTNYELAFKVAKYCLISFASAVVIDGLFLKYIDQEKAIRTKTLDLVEVEKRKGLMK